MEHALDFLSEFCPFLWKITVSVIDIWYPNEQRITNNEAQEILCNIALPTLTSTCIIISKLPIHRQYIVATNLNNQVFIDQEIQFAHYITRKRGLHYYISNINLNGSNFIGIYNLNRF